MNELMNYPVVVGGVWFSGWRRWGDGRRGRRGRRLDAAEAEATLVVLLLAEAGRRPDGFAFRFRAQIQRRLDAADATDAADAADAADAVHRAHLLLS